MSRARTTTGSWRIPRTGLVAAIATFLILGSSGVAYAYWSATATLTSTAKAGSIAVALSGFSSGSSTVQYTFVNDTRSRTGSVTVANTSPTTSATPIPVSVALGYVSGGSGVLAAKIDVTMWGPTTAASCTPTATPSGTIRTGTWASFPSMTDTLVAGQAKTWCVRASNAERSDIASPSGTISLQPKATATLTAGTWTATASATTTQNTQYIYPVAPISPTAWFRIHLTTDPSRCLDIRASGGAGTELIEWSCHGNPNQQFRLSGADSNGYLSVTPRHQQSLRWDNGGSTTPGSVIKIQSASGTGSQGWQFQQVSTGVYQIVNKNTGFCLAPGPILTNYNNETAYYQVQCDGSAAQRFTLENAPPVTLSLSCTTVDGSGVDGKNDTDLVYSWSAVDADSYTFQADQDRSWWGTDWKTIGTSAVDSTSVTIDGSLPASDPFVGWSRKTFDIQVLDSLNRVVATTTAEVRKNGELRCG
ncbi:MAG: RICIN domain-containing protein [Salinibacterium sp.]|nr:RICIN domain-containing protein [Salinibacterium sp.]